MNEQPFALFACKAILLAGAAWLACAFMTWLIMELLHSLK